uniref:Uncharacterized protein n=1 Tax=Arundo donax TaxID=35708 RepID=A0A0A9B5D7_ARUDO
MSCRLQLLASLCR